MPHVDARFRNTRPTTKRCCSAVAQPVPLAPAAARMLLSRALFAAGRHARRLHFCRPAHTSAPPPPAAPAGVDFDDVSKSFKSKSTWELARSLVIFKLCTFKPLVTHSKALLALSNKVFGQTLTSAVIKHSFFAHFCAGAWLGRGWVGAAAGTRLQGSLSRAAAHLRHRRRARVQGRMSAACSPS